MATDRLINSSQGADMIAELITIATNISQINKNIDLGANKVTSMAGYTLQSDASNITTSDTLNQAVSKLEKRVEDNKTNISKDEAALVELVNVGAKNLIRMTATSQKISMVSFTVNSDGTITTSGLMPLGLSSVVFTAAEFDIPAGLYHYSCEGGSVQNQRDSYVQAYDGTAWNTIARDYESGDFTISATTHIRVCVRVYSGYESGTFKPMICTKAAWDISQTYQPYKPNVLDSKMTRKQAITNGMYLVERQPKATTNPDTGNPYIYASFADFNYDFDSVEGITLTQFGIIYCNDGTAKVDELRLENVDGIHIIKKDSRSGSNLPVSGTNPVTAVGFTQYQDADGVTSDVLYTNDIGGDYRLLNAPSDIVALQQTIGDINSVLEEVL